jgi:hypothetical protein
MLLQGTHVPRNPSKALTYFQRAHCGHIHLMCSAPAVDLHAQVQP